MTTLILTNGDGAADLMHGAGMVGTIVPWRDALHEGPLCEGPLKACSASRIDWLASRFHIDRQMVHDEFAHRDQLMDDLSRFDQIELWFEHDLYDQLQLLQILDHLARLARTDGVVLVQADDFLGRQSPQTIVRFRRAARPLTAGDLDTGRDVWSALTSTTPAPLRNRLADQPDSPLPFLRPAMERFLRELPQTGSGLSLTEMRVLQSLSAEAVSGPGLFRRVIAREEAAFMGDWSFFLVLEDLAGVPEPLISGIPDPIESGGGFEQLPDAQLKLTATGRAVMDGAADHVSLNGIDRWWAGTHLIGKRVWRYDEAQDRLALPAVAEA